MISGGPKDTITSLWTKGLKALVPPNSFGPPTMVGVVVDFKDRDPDWAFHGLPKKVKVHGVGLPQYRKIL